MSDNAAVLVDGHHHLWDLTVRAQDWLDDPVHTAIRRTFTVDDLRTSATRSVARSSGLALAIVTAGIRTYANPLLTIGVRAEGTLR